MRLLIILFLFQAAIARSDEQPSLLQLKVAAESGDPQAEFEYGTQIEINNPQECAAMILRAAESGYGPAQNWAGNYYSLKISGDGNLLKQYRRLAVIFTARAAYKNIPQSQSRLASFYSSGDTLPRNPALAYGWATIAVKTSGETGSPIVTTLYKGQLDRFIANTPMEAISEGQKFSDSFRPQATGMNWVEADLIASELKLTGFINGNPIVNDIPLKPGVACKLTIDGEPVEILSLGWKPDSAHIQFVGSNFYVILPLGQGSGSTPVVRSW
jgi:hypothetical protein